MNEDIILRLTKAVDSIFVSVLAVVFLITGILGLFFPNLYTPQAALSWVLVFLGSFSVVLIVAKLRIDAKLDQVILMSKDNVFDNIDALSKRFPSKFRQLVTSQVKGFKADLRDLIENGALNVDDAEYFPILYHDALEIYSGAHLYATAVPRKYYFWSNESVLGAMNNFVDAGGKITRIFFLENEEELQDPEVRSVMDSQALAEIEVRHVVRSQVDPSLARYFLVAKSQEFGWTVKTTGENRIRGFRVSTDPNELEAMWIDMSKLMHLSRPYISSEKTGDDSSSPMKAEE